MTPNDLTAKTLKDMMRDPPAPRPSGSSKSVEELPGANPKDPKTGRIRALSKNQRLEEQARRFMV